jgi:hypothetical protein
MKKVFFLMALSFGFSAHAETFEFPISYSCGHGEVATAQPAAIPRGDGSFAVRVDVKCVPADCYVSLPRNGVRTVRLTAHMTLRSGSSPDSEKLISKMTASSKAEAKAEVQKLIDQGYCGKAIFESNMIDL